MSPPETSDESADDLRVAGTGRNSLTTSERTASSEAATPLGKRLLRWLLALLALALVGFFVYRWAGTSSHRGTVQRVYEKEAHYRIEFVDASGEVHVVGNEEIRFPYFKTNTADLQAELHRYGQTGDIIDLRTWGFRASWLSIFPNVLDAEFVRSSAQRQEEQVKLLTQTVVDELIDQGVVERGKESERMRPGLSSAIEKALSKPAKMDVPGAEPEEAP